MHLKIREVHLKIHKEVSWLRSGVFIINFKQRETNAKGGDNFTTKTLSMKNVEGKSSGLNKMCKK